MGIVHGADEGAAAHIFWLLMVLQAPIIIFFCAKYLFVYRKIGNICSCSPGGWDYFSFYLGLFSYIVKEVYNQNSYYLIGQLHV